MLLRARVLLLCIYVAAAVARSTSKSDLLLNLFISVRVNH